MHRLAVIAENKIPPGAWNGLKKLASHPWLGHRAKECDDLAEACDDAMWKAICAKEELCR